MTKVLVINAHPLTSKESRTVKILEVFLDEYKKKHRQDEIIRVDLFKEGIPEIDADMLHAWNELAQGKTLSDLTTSQIKRVVAFGDATEQFLRADKIVIANALWNLNIPTRLKAWFDTICVAGKTFKYTQTGPEPLTSGKKALHIQSAGGFYNNQDISSQYVKGLLNFVGVKEVEKISIEGIDYAPEIEAEVMEKAVDAAKQAAETF